MKMKQVEALPLEYEAFHQVLAGHKEIHWDNIDVLRDDYDNPLRVIVTLSSEKPGIEQLRDQDRNYSKEPFYHTLPNGLRIAHQSTFQTNILYPEIFDAEMYLRHGITLTPGDCVFDVGANIGLFTLFATQKCNNDVQVYAFEPSPPTFEILRTNASLHAQQTHLCNYGLSDTAGTASFTFFPYMSGMSGLFSQAENDRDIFKRGICNWVQEGENNYDRTTLSHELDSVVEGFFSHSETYECQLRTLSSVLEEFTITQVDLLKLDVERAELNVLRGIQKHDWQKIKQIVAEVHNKELLDQIIELLAHYDFDIVIETEENSSIENDEEHDNQYRLYMVYAIQRSATYGRAYRKDVRIEHKTIARPQLSVEEVRHFVQAKLPNYTLFGNLRNALRKQCPNLATLPIEFVIASPAFSR